MAHMAIRKKKKAKKKRRKKHNRGHTLFTPERADRFLKSLSRTGNITEACGVIGITRRTAYDWKEKDERFATLWEEAREIAADLLEHAAHNRAVEGWLEPVFHNGEICGYKRRFSDPLMQTLLRATRPKKFLRAPVSEDDTKQPEQPDPIHDVTLVDDTDQDG